MRKFMNYRQGLFELLESHSSTPIQIRDVNGRSPQYQLKTGEVEKAAHLKGNLNCWR